MPQRMTPDAILGEHEKFLLYGEYGTGKTFLAFTAPDPIWALGIGGTNEFKTLYGKTFIQKVGRKEVFFDFVREARGEQGQMEDNPTGFDHVCDKIDAFLEWNDKEGNPIRTIIVDNATILEEYMMNKAIAAEYAIAGNQEKSTLKREREYGIRKPHDSTYGGAQSLMNRLVSWLFELPFHLVFVAHEHQSFTQKEGTRERQLLAVRPLFVGQQRIMIPNMFDNVWRTTKSGGGRSATYQVQPTGDDKVAAKTRVGGILDPTLERDVNLTDVINEFKEHARQLNEQENDNA